MGRMMEFFFFLIGQEKPEGCSVHHLILEVIEFGANQREHKMRNQHTCDEEKYRWLRTNLNAAKPPDEQSEGLGGNIGKLLGWWN